MPHVEHSFLLYHAPFDQTELVEAAFLNLKLATATTGQTMDSTGSGKRPGYASQDLAKEMLPAA